MEKQKLKSAKNEIWKDVKNYEGIYKISNTGKVYSNTKKSGGKLLMGTVDSGGYKCLNLYKNAIREHKRIHNIVAEHFLNNANNEPCVDHIDQNKLNNNVNNLRYTSKKINGLNRKKVGGIGTSKYKQKNGNISTYYRVHYKPLDKKAISKHFNDETKAKLYLKKLRKKFKRSL